MRILALAILPFLSSLSFGEPTLYAFKFVVQNATVAKDANLAKKVAEVLNQTKISKERRNFLTERGMRRNTKLYDPSGDTFAKYCIDLRNKVVTKAEEIPGKPDLRLVKREEISVLISHPIDDSTVEDIRKALCTNYGDRVCDVGAGDREIATKDLNLDVLRKSGDKYIAEQTKKLSGIASLPMINKSCGDGEPKEFDHNAAGTDEAVNFLRDEKLSLHKADSLGLSLESFPVWNFGTVAPETRAKFPPPPAPTPTIPTVLPAATPIIPTIRPTSAPTIIQTVPLDCKAPSFKDDERCKPKPGVIQTTPSTTAR